MTDSMFWMHRDQIYLKELDVGFSTFSVGHLVWLLAIAVFCWLTGRLYCRLDERGRDNMRKTCALTVLLLEAAKTIVLGLFHVNSIEFLPLHLCSLGGLATTVYAMWPQSKKWLGQFFAYAFFPTALLAVVFPSTSMYPWWNFYCLHTFIFHALILAYFVWLFMSREVRPSYKGLLLSVVFMVIFAIPIYRINGAFGVNYMFIGNRSDVGILAMLWDMLTPSYGRIGYTVALCCILFVVLHLFYLIYLLIEKLQDRRDRR